MLKTVARIAAVLLLLMGLVSISPARQTSAETPDVDAWFSVSSTKPSVGCEVSVVIEIRTGGEPLPYADVQTALHVDGELVSADREPTGDDGITSLTLLTDDAQPGVEAWLDINVGNEYLTGLPITANNDGDCSAAGVYKHVQGKVNYEPPPVASNTSAGDGSDATFWVPTYHQQRGLSCEYAALYISTAAWLDPISEFAFDNVVGWNENPHIGYRGDITGSWGNTTDYGVYAEPLSWALPEFGFTGDAFYGGGTADKLKAYLDEGIPVLVWLSLWGDESVVFTDDEGRNYTVVAGEHVVVANGYDDAGVYVSDPGTGNYNFYTWDDFMYYWNILDGMGLAVYPS